jgi:hypothetical protein
MVKIFVPDRGSPPEGQPIALVASPLNSCSMTLPVLAVDPIRIGP